jgi:hypothetical protein
MKQYLLSVCYPAGSSQPEPSALTKIMNDIKALRAEMKSAGVWVFSGGLHAADSATVLRHQNGDIVLTDGPFIESKEQIGGFALVECDHLDDAIEVAARHPFALHGVVEVRPVWDE